MAEGAPGNLPQTVELDTPPPAPDTLAGDLYAVTAVLPGGRQLPTFFLDANVQGIVSEIHAREIAREILARDADIMVIKL